MSYSAQSRSQGDGQFIEERPGHITSDSLAAESLQNNGSFGANESNVSYSSQPSRSTTANTRDTSAATTLPPTSSNTGRLPSDLAYDTPASTSNASERAGTAYHSRGLEGGATGGAPSPYGNADAAPGYTGNRGLTREQAAVKGTSVPEGEGFTGGEKNASFASDIGSRQDPGRVAEQGFARANARAGFDAAYEGASAGKSGGGGAGGFENLERDERA